MIGIIEVMVWALLIGSALYGLISMVGIILFWRKVRRRVREEEAEKSEPL